MADPQQKLAILVFDDSIDRVHYALVMASAAAAVNQQVTLFCAGQAIHLLTKVDMGKLGWHRLGPSQDGMTALQFDSTLKRHGGAGVETLLSACRDLDVSFICCELATKMGGIDETSFRDDLPVEHAGVTTLLARAERQGRIISF